MSELHRRLRRQLRAHFGPGWEPPAEMAALIEAVNAAYHSFDADRGLLERSLELSSRELLQANSDMRAVVQAFPDLFLWLRMDGTVLGVRASADDPYFLDLHKLTQTRLTESALPGMADIRDAFAQFLHQGYADPVEYQVPGPTGTETYEARLAPLGESQILGIVRRVTERVRSIESQRRTVALLRSTLEATADGILVVGKDRDVITYNRKFTRMWQMPEQFSGSDEEAIDLVLPQLLDPEGFAARVEELYTTPDLEGFDEIQFKDGRVFERYSIPFTSGTEFRGRVWSFRDVTQRRQAERALREREEELRHAQKMEAIGKLAGGIAHDFNNVLMAINGYAALALHHEGIESERRFYLEEILKGGERAAALTRQLLVFGRKQVLNPRALSLNTVVKNLDSMLRRVLGEDIRFELHADPNLHSVMADPVQMEQVLMNLMVNARDAMPGGGTIRVETANTTLEPDPEGQGEGGEYVRLSVSDSGVGMDPATRQRIFEPFFTTKPVGRGTGLGLSTVYGIVRQSQGRLKVDSELGKGTTLHVFLPRVEAEPQAAAPGTAVLPDRDGAGSTVLLVEDENQVRMLLRTILTQNGYHVLEAADGEEAVRLCEGYPASIDLMLTDLIMPGLHGDAAFHRIRPSRPFMKVLFMSGYADGEERSKILEGAEFLQKPAAPDLLLARIAELLQGPPAAP